MFEVYHLAAIVLFIIGLYAFLRSFRSRGASSTFVCAGRCRFVCWRVAGCSYCCGAVSFSGREIVVGRPDLCAWREKE